MVVPWVAVQIRKNMSVVNLSEVKPDIQSVDCQISVQGSGDGAGNWQTIDSLHARTHVRLLTSAASFASS